MLKQKIYLPYLLFLGIAAVAFFQVSFYLNSPKYDMIDCFYPWRFYIGECLQNGQLPYWNPYQDLGYPIHADPSSGAWYPIVWLIGYFNGYSIYSIGFELWIHVFFAGIGFYTLARTLKLTPQAAILAGIAYMLSGFFIGNSQHLPYIVSAAWLPFILNYYFRLMEEKSYLNCLKAAFFLFLIITGGYPAITIILFYLLLIFFIIQIIRIVKSRIWKDLNAFLKRNILFFIYTVLLSSAMLMAVLQVSPYLSRLGNFSLEQSMYSPFSPQSFISFILPLASTTKTDLFFSDLSMRNSYFGILIFLFFIFSLFNKKTLFLKVLFYFGLFSLSAAVGQSLPVREFLFKYIPMMNVFRNPGVFRLFFIIGAVLSSVYCIQELVIGKKWNKKYLIIGTLFMVFVLVTLIVMANFSVDLSLRNYIHNNLFVASDNSTFWQNVAFQSILQLVFLIAFLFVLLKFENGKKAMIYMILLTAIDLIVATQLNAPYTVYYDNVSAKEASKNVSKYEKGFPSQQNITLEEGGHLPLIGTPFWQNMNTFQKQITAEGFNSFSFTSYDILESEYPQLFNEIKKNKLLSLSDSIFPEKEMKKFKKDSLFGKDQLFLNERDYNYLSQRTFSVSKGDTAYLRSYDAAHFAIASSLKFRSLLTIHQKEYKGWKAYVNGKKVRIFKSNLNFMTIMVPAGKNEVLFVYKNPVLKGTFLISVTCLLFFFGVILFEYIRSKRKLV